MAMKNDDQCNDSIAFFTLRCFIEYIHFIRLGINTIIVHLKLLVDKYKDPF